MNRIWQKLLTLMIILLIISCESKSAENTGRNPTSETSHSGSEIYSTSEQGNRAKSISNDEITSSRKNSITKAVEMASPAIVGINVTEVRTVEYRDPFYDDPFFSRFFGRRKPRVKQYEVQGLGSGFVISPNGYILTNHHVAGHASKLIVTMSGGKEYNAEIIGSDFVSDVALIKIDAENLPYLKFSDSDNIITGEWVIAMGNPFGLFSNNAKPTVTVGVISNTGINFVQDDRVYKDMIQTDAAISSGNSGGPLLNALGEVIGMNTVIFSTAQSNQGAGSIGIGFSIPINRVKHIINLIKENGSIERNYYIGMDVSKINDRIKDYFNLENDNGVVVINLYRRSPAEKTGIEPGDIILEINNQKINREEDYYILIKDGIVGETFEFTILRDNKEIKRKMVLTKANR